MECVGHLTSETSLRTSETGRDNNGELEVGYIPLHNDVAYTFPQPSGHMSEVPVRFLDRHRAQRE